MSHISYWPGNLILMFQGEWRDVTQLSKGSIRTYCFVPKDYSTDKKPSLKSIRKH